MRRLLMLLVILISTLPISVLASPLVLPQTGQTVCYDAGGNIINCVSTRQDGDLKSGSVWPNPRFVDNGNEKVVDNLTNILWAKHANAPESNACGVPEAMTWQQALDYIACLNTTAYLGVQVWALPNVNQLLSLVNYGQADNASWLTEIPGTKAGFNFVQNDQYWTNDTYAADPSKAWSVAMGGNGVIVEDKINTFNRVWPICIAPDLTVSVTAPGTALTGQNLTIPVTYKNIGQAGSLPGIGFYVDLYLSTDSTITAGDIYLGRKVLDPLGAGAEVITSFTFIMPQVTSGNYYFGAIIDQGNYNFESNEANNAIAGPATSVSYGPDLTVSVAAPGAVLTGQNLTIPVTYKNIGQAGSLPGQGFYVDLYLSADSTITTGDIYLGYKVLDALGAGTEAITSFTFLMPQVTSGNYYFGAIIDRGNLNYESNEANNAVAGTVTSVSYGPDLTVSVTAPDSALTGQNLTIPVTYKNIGQAGSLPGQGFYVDLYLSADSTITAGDIYLGRKVLGALGAGTEAITNFTFIMPQVTSGNYYFGAIIDQGNLNYESNEANNAVAGSVTSVSYGPDLTVSVTAPGAALAGQNLTIPVIYKNIGQAGSLPGIGFYVDLYLSADSTITTGDIYLGRKVLGALGAGTEATTSFVFTAPQVTPGNYYFGAIIDQGNLNYESNEANNAVPAQDSTLLE